MSQIVVLGIFVADVSFRAPRLPIMGETLLAEHFALGPGGKGSNQAVAAARTGGDTAFISKLGDDTFAAMAETLWKEAGVTPAIDTDADSYTGSASIMIEATTGNNAIIVAPGAAATLTPDDIDAKAPLISSAKVFLTQLEQPIDAAARALSIARAAGVATILNPAPAHMGLSAEILSLCDYLTPNETEAEGLTGIKVTDITTATHAAEALCSKGVGAVIVTLGENGALFYDGTPTHIPALTAGPVVETTGAGDAFNGGFATALAEGQAPRDALRFATATAALSVTRPGAAASMPTRGDVLNLLSRN